MKLHTMIGELELRYREAVDHANNLERAIDHQHVRRPISDVHMMRSRHPTFAAACRALRLIDEWRAAGALPAEFIAEVEADQ